MSSRPIVGKAGMAPSTSRSVGSTMWRTLAAAARDSSTPGRNHPIVATTLAWESRKMLAVASTPSVGYSGTGMAPSRTAPKNV